MVKREQDLNYARSGLNGTREGNEWYDVKDETPFRYRPTKFLTEMLDVCVQQRCQLGHEDTG